MATGSSPTPIKERLRAYSASKNHASKPNSGSKELCDINTTLEKETETNNTEESQQAGVKMGERSDQSENSEDLATMIKNLTSAVNNIQKDVTDLKTSKSQIVDVNDHLSSLSQYREQQRVDSVKIKLLSQIVIRQEQKIDYLCNQLDGIRREQKKPNLFLDGILEDSSESEPKGSIKLVQKFLKEQMEMKESVELKQAFRIGTKNPRTMKIVLTDPEDKVGIFSNTANLKGRKTPADVYFS